MSEPEEISEYSNFDQSSARDLCSFQQIEEGH